MEKSIEENKEIKSEKAVKEIMKICKDLRINVDAKEATNANKFLSAWHKQKY